MDISDPFRPQLERALNYEADPFLRVQEGSETLKPKQGRLTFHDRHIPSNLSCRRVVEFPQIAQVLSKVCDNAIVYYHAEGNTFSEARFSVLPKDSPLARIDLLDDSRNMNIRYKRSAGHFSSLLASQFFYSGGPWSFILELVWNYAENDFFVRVYA